MEKTDKNKIKTGIIGLIVGGICGYMSGIIYFYLFTFIFIKLGALNFWPKISEFLILKDTIIILNQLISSVLGILIGYYYFENKKLAIIFSTILLVYYVIFILLWLYFIAMVGPLFG